MTFDEIAGAAARGALAGAAGTAAMTLSSTLEAKLRDRGGSSAPSDAAGKVLGVQPRNPDGAARFATVVHWGYGTGWGTVRGVLAALGMSGAPAAAAHWASIWGSSLVMLPALDIAPPPWKTEPTELGIDAFHHAVYAVATSAAFAVLD